VTDLRRPTADDADAVLAVLVARDIVDLGEPDIELADVLADWALPDVDLARDAWVAEDDGGAVVAYGLVLRDDAFVYVHPEAERRGIGTALREACEARAAEKDVAVLRQFLPVGNEAGRALLLEAGYWPVQHYSRLRIPLDEAPAPADAGLRAFDRARDEEGVHALIQETVAEIEGNVPQPLETWRVTTIEKEGWDPSLWLLLEDAEGLAGAVLGERWDVNQVGYVAQLGVAPRARGRGYGRALLLGAFEAFRRAGLKEAELSVHGANAGALRLYESVGMKPVWHAERWEKPLGHG
jgi:mycothiol synthase